MSLGVVDESDETRLLLHWETALDRLELDVILAERLLEDPTRQVPEPWDEPQLTGPIPGDLQERAVSIAHRQRRVQDRLREKLTSVGRQHAFADRIQQATRPVEVPVYLDLRA